MTTDNAECGIPQNRIAVGDLRQDGDGDEGKDAKHTTGVEKYFLLHVRMCRSHTRRRTRDRRSPDKLRVSPYLPSWCDAIVLAPSIFGSEFLFPNIRGRLSSLLLREKDMNMCICLVGCRWLSPLPPPCAGVARFIFMIADLLHWRIFPVSGTQGVNFRCERSEGIVGCENSLNVGKFRVEVKSFSSLPCLDIFEEF